MKYTITPYAYRKIRETIKQSLGVVKEIDKYEAIGPTAFSKERITIKLTIIK